jgi:uncharacterized protein YgfB (UPF0149 family)
MLCRQADLDFGAAECHGILSGLISTAGQIELQHWLGLLYSDGALDNLHNNDRVLWQSLYEQTLQQLTSNDLGFQLLLPDDAQPLSQRTEALTDWCRGMLYGISAANLKMGPDLPDDVNDFIQDLTHISSADYDEDEDSNEAETAYVELVEYLRAGTMLIYTELQIGVQPTTDKPILH